MKIDLSCPVELIEWELLRDDREHARAYLKMRSLAKTPVTALEGVVRWIDAETDAATDSPFSADGMSLAPGAAITLPVSSGYLPRSVRLEVVFQSVTLADGRRWLGEEDALREYPDPPRLSARLSNALAADAGEDAVCCAQEREDGGWLCVCGRQNSVGMDECARCGRSRAEVLFKYGPESVERLAEISAGPFAKYYAPFGTDSMPEAADVSRRAGGRLRALMLSLLLAAALACAALGVRTLRYRGTQAAGLTPTSRVTHEETEV